MASQPLASSRALRPNTWNLFAPARSRPPADYRRVADDEPIELNHNSTPEKARQPSGRREIHVYRVGLALALLAVIVLYARLPRQNQPWSSVTTPSVDARNKALVLASYNRQDTAWTDEVANEWQVVRYLNDDANPHHLLTVPRQRREAITYLTYIIDHYDLLPDIIAFIHGDYTSWHNPEPIPLKLAALNYTALAQENFINFRCNLFPACTEDTLMGVRAKLREDDDRAASRVLPHFFETMFPKEQNWGMGEPPEVIGSACCSQFAVTKQAIQSRPLEFWKMYRKPLERDFEDYRDMFGEVVNAYDMGVVYERFWHMLFGRPAANCVDPDYCKRVHFQNAIECSMDTSLPEANDVWRDVTCTLNQDRIANI